MKSTPLLMLLIPLCAWSQSGQKVDLSLSSAANKALAIVSVRLQVKGLEHPVDVLRDRWGVAHIYAQNQHDLFFGQGVVAAQDRLFQMELWKRAARDDSPKFSALPRYNVMLTPSPCAIAAICRPNTKVTLPTHAKFSPRLRMVSILISLALQLQAALACPLSFNWPDFRRAPGIQKIA